MNKWSWLTVVIVGVMLLFSGVAVAKVSGPCADCHTMHYSQHGKKPGETGFPTESPYDLWTGTEGPYEALLVDDCVGCHSGATARKGASDEIPVVLRTTEPSGTGPGKSLAGGDFYWVNNGDSTKGHDVIDLPNISGQDSNLGLTPPGWDTTGAATEGWAGTVAGGATSWNSQLTCAGTYGCHGDHDESTNAGAIRGAHHGDDSCLKAGSVNENNQGGTVATSYRWCGGIHGIEDDDWEWTASNTDHNQYKGVDGNTGYSDKTTISYLCAECHGVFHSDIGGTSSPWTRHPTDFALGSASGSEYADYNGSGHSYSVEAPVGRDNIDDGIVSTVTPTGTEDCIVLCVSCHRAHGTEYDDLLRWNYDEMIAGEDKTGGCFICHTTK